MESRIRILRWLSLLLLSAGIAARSRMLFWRPDDTEQYFKKKKLKEIQRTNKLKRLTMKIRIRLLHWLSLLQLSACLGCQLGVLSHFALFRRT